MLHDALVAVHVAAGGVGLLTGALAPFALLLRRLPRGWHVRLGWAYQVACALLCSTVLALVGLDPSLWPFALIAVPTWAAATAGAVVRRRRRPGWLAVHVQLVLGSYVSFVTAFVVQTAGGLAWVVPVVLGSTAVAVVTTRVKVQQARAVAPAVLLAA